MSRRLMVPRVIVIAAAAALFLPCRSIDPVSTLECHRRQYSYKVQQSDSEGHICWDHINVMSCWGRCDSNEIADWIFPYKKSHHPVCLHSSTHEKKVNLRNCDVGAAPDTSVYTFQEASSCACSYCRSSEASCEGLRYRGARRAPQLTKRMLLKSTTGAGDQRGREKDQLRRVGLSGRIENQGDIHERLINTLRAMGKGSRAKKSFSKADVMRDPLKISRKAVSSPPGLIPFLDSSFEDSDFLAIFSSPSDEDPVEDEASPGSARSSLDPNREDERTEFSVQDYFE